MGDNIDKILEGRRQQAPPSATPKEDDADKFYSVLGGDLVDDPFLELRFRDGFRLFLPYRDVVWFSYSAKEPEIRMDFGSTSIRIKGRGLAGELLDGLRQKRVVWVKEADHEMQDHDKNKVFIAEISFDPEDEAAPPAE